MGRFSAAKTTLIWFVVRPNLWERGDLRSHTGCSSGLVCNENGDKRRASKYLRRVLERFFGASISLPTKTSWCQATVVAFVVVGNANHWGRGIPRVGTRRRAVATEWMIYWATR